MSEPKTKIVKIKVSLNIGIVGGQRDELEVEVPIDATDEEIERECEQATSDWANNYIDYGYHIIED